MLNMYYNPNSFAGLMPDSNPTETDQKNYSRHLVYISIRPLMIVQLLIAFFIAVSVVAGAYFKDVNVFTPWTDYVQIALILAMSAAYFTVRPKTEEDIQSVHTWLIYINAVLFLFYGIATVIDAHMNGRPSVQFVVALILVAMMTNIRFMHVVILNATAGIIVMILSFVFKPKAGLDLEMYIVNTTAVLLTIYMSGVKSRYNRENYFQKILLEKQQLALSNVNQELETMLHDQLDTILRSEMLTRYLPPELVDLIINGKHPERTAEKAKLTVFFSDIKDFTKNSDTMAPEELARILNEYMDEMIKIAKKYHATLDKFVGDAIMIFFGAPEKTNDRDHALRCVKMAVEMQQSMKTLQKKWFEEGYEKPFSIRIGINTGVSIVGNFGSIERLSYTAIGKQVNIAARLEQACEPGSILISHPTYALVKDEIKCDGGAKYSLKGLAEEVTAYKVEF